MAIIEHAMIIEGLFNPAALIASRDWEPLAEGVFISPIYDMKNSGPRAAFLRYLPGASVPHHQHTGIEHILILQGSQKDGSTVYQAGTLVIHPPGTQHHLISEEGCLALGVWEKPVAFTAPSSRLTSA